MGADTKLLRQYIREALSGFGLASVGAGNLRPDSAAAGPMMGAEQNKNIIDDEQDDSDQASQDKPQAACCLILSDDGHVLAVSRKDDPSAFGLPGGKVDPGEVPEQAAARELQEETGLTATSLHQVFVREEDDGFTTTTFACEVEGQIDTPETGVVRWVKPEVLFAGPFGRYNRMLWKKLGLSTGNPPSS